MTDPPLPPQAVADAIDALYWSPLLDGIDLEGWLRTIATVVLEAAQPPLRADERRRFTAELGGSDHYVIYTEDRWTIEHPVECRLSARMHECSIHRAIAAVSEKYDQGMAGRWRIDGIDDEGLPSLTRADFASPLGGDQP